MLNVGFRAETLHQVLNRPLAQFVADSRFDLFQVGNSALALFFNVDHMPAELALHRGLGVSAGLQIEGCIAELRNDFPLGEEADIAAVLGGRAGRFFLGQVRKLGAAIQFFNDLLGFFLRTRIWRA